jgi:predicted nucleic acid-binding protein
LFENVSFALPESVMQGFIRIAANPKIDRPLSSLQQALGFLDALIERPKCMTIGPGEWHWTVFRRWCEKTGIGGPPAADAVRAALAIEPGCEWSWAAADFARFSPPLRWRPL